MLYEYRAVVAKVIDGDTARLTVDLGFNLTINEKFRFAGIDAPEMSTQEGKNVKAQLVDKIEGKQVTVISEGKDKYGRWLGTIFLDGENVNRWLLTNGLAAAYK